MSDIDPAVLATMPKSIIDSKMEADQEKNTETGLTIEATDGTVAEPVPTLEPEPVAEEVKPARKPVDPILDMKRGSKEPQDNYEKRYKDLQGQTTKVAQENSRIKKEAEELRREVEDLKNLQGYSEVDELADFGSQTEQTHNNQDEIRELTEEMRALKDDIQWSVFKDRIDSSVPDINEINSDPDFLDWTEQPIPETGEKRVDVLTKAWNNLNATVVINMFNGFKAYRDQADTINPQTPVSVMPSRSPAPAVPRIQGIPDSQEKVLIQKEALADRINVLTRTGKASTEAGMREYEQIQTQLAALG